MSNVIDFLATHAAVQPDGTFSAEVTSLIRDAISSGQGTPSRQWHAVIWRSALAHRLLDAEVRSACASYCDDLAAELWLRLSNRPGDSLGDDAGRYAAALDETGVSRLIKKLGTADDRLPAAGHPGYAAWSVLLAHDDPVAIAELHARAPTDFVLIPAGEFVLGGGVKADEKPAVRRWLPSFFMARFPVTVGDLRRFSSATGTTTPVSPTAEPDWPAHHIGWPLAVELTTWLGGRLPAEAEWEKAARGPAGTRFPWGSEFAPGRANTLEAGIGEFTPVDRYSGVGCSGYGVADMVGNAWEWTGSTYRPYAKERTRGADPRPLDETADRVLRGGAYDFDQHGSNCLNRYRCHPDRGWDTHGVRAARGL